jgi:formylmethanofuran dehydrogenase subunit A
MKLLEGHRGHLTHIQFHSYAGGEADEDTFGSKVAPLAEYVNDHANLTVDVGQVVFGPTMSMTADGPVGYYLSRLYKSRWFSSDIEQEAGCGIAPIEYKNTSAIHTWQWAIGLEWYLLVNDPWRVAMSTDHPNGGSFLAYPQIIRLLMDRTYRQDMLKTLPAAVRDRSGLKDLDREYSLSEIAIITRAGPARMLGLTHKGHLGVGADADVTIYTPDSNAETMFQLPRHVIKAGRLLVEQGEIREAVTGKTLHVAPDYDREVETDIRAWFEDAYSIRWRNYPVDEELLSEAEVIS